MMRSCVCINSAAFVTDKPGKVVGIYIKVPSFRTGMNSDPSCRAGQIVTIKANSATMMVRLLAFSTARMIGR